MNKETDDLQLIKRLNRKIVQRAFQNSSINANYSFPKTISLQQNLSDAHDLVSLQSRISERYNLYEQNLLNNKEKNQQRQIIPIKKLLKERRHQGNQGINEQFSNPNFSFAQNRPLHNKQLNSRKKYLSLSTDKSKGNSKNKDQSYQKSIGIQILKSKNKKNQIISSTKSKKRQTTNYKHQQSNVTANLLVGIKQFSERCFSVDCKKNSGKTQQNEMIFQNSKIILSKQRLLKTHKIHVSETTADSSPAIFSKKQQKNVKQRRQFARFNPHRNVFVSPFYLG